VRACVEPKTAKKKPTHFLFVGAACAQVKESEVQDIVACMDQIEAHYTHQLVLLSNERGAKLRRIGALCSELDGAELQLASLQERLQAFYVKFMKI
jgi:hypothetical protein